jgi:hypothetical protein
MGLCPLEKCEHYSKATRYERACYYGEPQCWKGWLDLIGMTLWLATFVRFKMRKESKRPHKGFKNET